MKFSPDNDWQDRTKAGYLRRLMDIYFTDPESKDIPEITDETNPNPKTMESCIQMLFDRVHLYAENGYSSYSHEWEIYDYDISNQYTLEEVVELAEEVFLDCKITLEKSDILCCASSSSNPPVVGTHYELVIDWEESPSMEELEKKWNDCKERCREERRKYD